MLYTILCYNSEAAVGAWSKQQEAVILKDRATTLQRLRSERRLGFSMRLMPTTTATTVRASGAAPVLDGPFAETKEQLLGLYLVECPSLADAIEVAQALVRHSGGALEVRPVNRFDAGELA